MIVGDDKDGVGDGDGDGVGDGDGHKIVQALLTKLEAFASVGGGGKGRFSSWSSNDLLRGVRRKIKIFTNLRYQTAIIQVVQCSTFIIRCLCDLLENSSHECSIAVT